MLKKRYTDLNPCGSRIGQGKRFSSQGIFCHRNSRNLGDLSYVLKSTVLQNAKSLSPKDINKITNQLAECVLIKGIKQPALYIKDHPYQIFCFYGTVSSN